MTTIALLTDLVTRLEAMASRNGESVTDVLTYLITTYCDAGDAIREAGDQARENDPPAR